MNIINNNNDITIMEDGTVLKRHDCSHRFIYDSEYVVDLSKYPDKYKYWGEIFKILKGQSSVSLRWAIHGSERGFIPFDDIHSLNLYKKIINIYLEKTGFNIIIKDYIVVIHCGLLSHQFKESIPISGSYYSCAYKYTVFFDNLGEDFENKIKPSGIFRGWQEYNFSYYLHKFIFYISNNINKNEKLLEEMKRLPLEKIIEILNIGCSEIGYDTCFLVKYHKEGELYFKECSFIGNAMWYNAYWYDILEYFFMYEFFYYIGGAHPKTSYYVDNSDIIGYGVYKQYVEDMKKDYRLI